MDKEEILQTIYDLSKSQGFYGRLYQIIKTNNELLDELEAQHFKDYVDLILYLEG